ncbi:nudix hydrolase 15, mitochondrial-like [Zingiber officinale]|uniref:Nudix hydrolase domain-containing protein n=1 Tax=Zingiber officinale TaxID=94328 RepID=A0A8J5IAH7_ZINOF|nr:nudix hydrolase 15, mitochondrial-like [Zingiber officinale]KAG6531541.1 hypothetical protein ZIOFF_005355 [Zingiber officinale]
MRRLRTAVRMVWYSSISASPPPCPRQSSLPKLAMYPRGRRLHLLAQQLRHYRPSGPDESVLDDRDKVSSTAVLPVSSASDDIRRSTPSSARAAVLVCIFEGDCGDLRVILTKRSSNLSTHSGEVSLPGGKAEECDADDRETALREAKEEIGLDPSIVTVVTNLKPFLSKHLLRVTPIIGILPDKQSFVPLLNASEVDEMFDAPLEMFLKEENHRSEELEWEGGKSLFHFFDYRTGKKTYLIWGMTANILIRAASIVYKRPPAFSEYLPKL